MHGLPGKEVVKIYRQAARKSQAKAARAFSISFYIVLLGRSDCSDPARQVSILLRTASVGLASLVQRIGGILRWHITEVVRVVVRVVKMRRTIIITADTPGS